MVSRGNDEFYYLLCEQTEELRLVNLSLIFIKRRQKYLVTCVHSIQAEVIIMLRESVTLLWSCCLDSPCYTHFLQQPAPTHTFTFTQPHSLNKRKILLFIPVYFVCWGLYFDIVECVTSALFTVNIVFTLHDMIVLS